MEAVYYFLPLILLGIIGLIMLAFKTFIKAWIDNRIHAISAKEIARFRSELDAEKAHIAAIRDGVLSGRMSRQAIVDQRRFNAIDQLWASVLELDHHAMVPRFLEVIKLDVVFDKVESEPKFRELFTFFGKMNPTEPPIKATNFQRHYIPQRVSDLYGLYVGIIGLSVGIVSAAQNGFDPRKMLNLGGFDQEVIKHLPHFSNYLEKYSPYGWISLASVTRDALSLEIRSFVEGTDADYSALENAASNFKVIPTKDEQAIHKAIAGLPENLKQDLSQGRKFN